MPLHLGINETSRLLGSLRKEGVPARRLIVNQLIDMHGEGFAAHKADLADKEVALRAAMDGLQGAEAGAVHFPAQLKRFL